MSEKRKYTTELSKGQGMIGETLALLQLWTPGMSVVELKAAAVQEGAIGRATSIRVKDIVGRVFAKRYLREQNQPAIYLKRLMDLGVSGKTLGQLLLIHTARAHVVLHDFISQVYWTNYSSGARMIGSKDALSFLEQAANNGFIHHRWSDTLMLRMSRNLTGCLEDFQLAGPSKAGRREILPFTIHPLTALYLSHEIHFAGFSDNALLEHEDWKLFGLEPMDVRHALERAANGHLIAQFSGDLVRISWKYKTMEEAIRGIAAAGL